MKLKFFKYINVLSNLHTSCKIKQPYIGRIYFSCIVFFISAVFIGCHRHNDTSSHNNEIPSIFVDIKNVQEGLTSTNFSDYKIVPLETKDESLIKYIDKLVLFRERMYVLDLAQNTIFIFSNEGRFLFKISHIGKGPGEYEQLRDFCIDSLENKIILHSDRPYKILYYGIEGKFIEEKEVNGWYKNIVSTGKNLVLYNRSSGQKEKYKIMFQSKVGRKKNMFLPYSGQITRVNIAFQNICQSYATYFYEALNDTVYRINESDIEPAYYIDFGEYKVPENLRRSTNTNEIFREVVSTNKYGYFISNFRETDKYIIFKYEPARIVFYSKAEKKTDVYSTIKDERTGLGVQYFAHDGKDNKFISILPARSFSNYPPGIVDHFTKTYPDYKKMKTKYNNIKEDDNPVIVIYTLK